MALDPREAANLLNDLHSILVVVRGEWQKQSAWSEWDQSVYERLLSAQTAYLQHAGEAVAVAWIDRLMLRSLGGPTVAVLTARVTNAPLGDSSVPLFAAPHPHQVAMEASTSADPQSCSSEEAGPAATSNQASASADQGGE